MRVKMPSRWKILMLCGALIGAAWAQDRDFLTAEEVDKVRATQEPNARIQLYLGFAELRVAQLEQLLSRERAGRSSLVHDLLEDYTNIIDALDTVTDDALRRRIDMTKGLAVVTPAEQLLLARLEKIKDAEHIDLPRFEFTLMDAIDATEGSIELAGDLVQRSDDLAARDQRDAEIRRAADPDAAKRAEEEKKKQPQPKKAPTLRRPGDPPPSNQK